MTDRNKERNGTRQCSRSQSVQRWVALMGGAALAAIGIKRHSAAGIALVAGGGLLAYTAATSKAQPRNVIAKGAVLINCSPQEAYRFWSDPLNLPLFMRRLDSVTNTGEGRYRWVALGPAGSRLVWETETTHVRESESIEWQSVPGSDLEMNGHVKFQETPAQRGTELRVELNYRLPVGGFGRVLNRYLGKIPSFWLRQDLRRLKALIETGEIPTTEGQSHGKRSAKVAALRLANPDRPVRPGAHFKEQFSAERRIA